MWEAGKREEKGRKIIMRRERKMSLHLIIGANASGKSHYAEKKASASWLLSSGKGGLIYLATMLSGKDDETQKRIRRHRERRAGMGFLLSLIHI